MAFVSPLRGLGRRFARKEVLRQVVKDWGSEAKRVDSVEHTAMAFDQRAVVFHTSISFDGRHAHHASKSQYGDH